MVILPHALAYAPLTSLYLPLSALLVAFVVVILLIYFQNFRNFFKTKARQIVKLFTGIDPKKALAFTVTFVVAFIIYFILFGIGDHAFDMLSQKLWSYDTAKYGLISIFQRPAVTSAAAVFSGIATQHAIFPYGPIAGLYYLLIGKSYFAFTSSPAVADVAFTFVVKAFQTIVTLGCGVCAYKIVRRYGYSFRKSFLVMLLFIFNPLIIYDAAVWGHQDSFLILFLLIALWSYEYGHPKIAYSSVTL